MASTIDLSAMETAVTNAETVTKSVEEFIRQFATKVQEAVAAALAADDAADQGSIDAANLAIKTTADRVSAVAARLGAAINA